MKMHKKKVLNTKNKKKKAKKEKAFSAASKLSRNLMEQIIPTTTLKKDDKS